MQQQSHLPRQHLHQQRSPYPVQQVNQFQGKNPLVFPVWSQWPKGSKCVKALWLLGLKQWIQAVAHTTYFTKDKCPSLHIQLSLCFPFCSLQWKLLTFSFFFLFPPLFLNDICFASLTSRCHGFIHRFILWTSTLMRFFPASTSDCILVLPLLHSPLYLIRWAENLREVILI